MITHTLTSKQASNNLSQVLKGTNQASRTVTGPKFGILTTGDAPTFDSVVERPSSALGFRGFLHFPLPDWPFSESPVGNPEFCANYLLDRYTQFGEKFLDGIWGRFSIVGFDIQNNLVFAGTDPYGSLDVFYGEVDEEPVISSSLYSYSLAASKALEINKINEDFLLTYGFIPPGETVFNGVKKLRSAELLLYNEDGGFRTTEISDVDEPWESSYRSDQSSEGKVLRDLRDALFRAVEEQLPDEEEVALLLGGFDSALVGSVLKDFGKKVRTYSFHYEAENYNQPFVREVAEFIDAEHTWVQISPEMIATGFEFYSHLFNTPTNWPNYVIQTQELAKRIKQDGINHCFSGDGCDYLFYGYPLTFRRNQIIQRLSSVPRPLSTGALKVLGWRPVEWALGRPGQVAMGVLRNSQHTQPERSFLNFRIFDPILIERLRSGEKVDRKSVSELATRLSRPFEGLEPDRLAYIGKTMLAPYKIKMEGSSSLAGITVTAPYLHQGMVNLARQIPEELLRPTGKNRSTIGKYALAKMASSHGLLPDEIIYQPKLGAVDAPTREWYSGDVWPSIEKSLADLPFEVDLKRVNRLLEDKLAERAWSSVISRETSGLVSLDHGVSLLATYGSIASLRNVTREPQDSR